MRHAVAETKNDADCNLAECPDDGEEEAVLGICPDLPLIHPLVRSTPEVHLSSNNTQLLGFP